MLSPFQTTLVFGEKNVLISYICNSPKGELAEIRFFAKILSDNFPINKEHKLDLLSNKSILFLIYDIYRNFVKELIN